MADIITFYRITNSEVVGVGGINNVLVAQLGIGAAEHANNIRGGDALVTTHGMNLRCNRQRKSVGLAGVGIGTCLCKRFRRACEQHVGAALAEKTAGVQFGK